MKDDWKYITTDNGERSVTNTAGFKPAKPKLLVTNLDFSEYLFYLTYPLLGWWRGTVVERRSLAGELSLSCARPAADG